MKNKIELTIKNLLTGTTIVMILSILLGISIGGLASMIERERLKADNLYYSKISVECIERKTQLEQILQNYVGSTDYQKAINDYNNNF